MAGTWWTPDMVGFVFVDRIGGHADAAAPSGNRWGLARSRAPRRPGANDERLRQGAAGAVEETGECRIIESRVDVGGRQSGTAPGFLLIGYPQRRPDRHLNY